MAGRDKRKSEDANIIEVVQTMWVDTTTLTIDKNRCISCNLCKSVCPMSALSLKVESGRAVPAADESKCSLCGLCVEFCPAQAIRMTERNSWKQTEVERRPILEVGGVPHFSKGMTLDATLCPEGCDLCVAECPRNALQKVESAVELDRTLCLSCSHCRDVCPVEGAITIDPLFDGGIQVDTGKCPIGCELCIVACPTKCYTKTPPRGVHADARHCICCGACQVACFYGAIDLSRLRINCEGEGYSAVWSRAVDQVLSENARFLEQNGHSMSRLEVLLKDSRL